MDVTAMTNCRSVEHFRGGAMTVSRPCSVGQPRSTASRCHWRVSRYTEVHWHISRSNLVESSLARQWSRLDESSLWLPQPISTSHMEFCSFIARTQLMNCKIQIIEHISKMQIHRKQLYNIHYTI